MNEDLKAYSDSQLATRIMLYIKDMKEIYDLLFHPNERDEREARHIYALLRSSILSDADYYKQENNACPERMMYTRYIIPLTLDVAERIDKVDYNGELEEISSVVFDGLDDFVDFVPIEKWRSIAYGRHTYE